MIFRSHDHPALGVNDQIHQKQLDLRRALRSALNEADAFAALIRKIKAVVNDIHREDNDKVIEIQYLIGEHSRRV